MGNLDGKTILITGASSGFGEAIALSCADEGASVALVARRTDKLESIAQTIRANGGTAGVCTADVIDDSQIHATIAGVTEKFGAIDVLVNNAGSNVTERSIADTSPEQWRQLIDLNLTSAFILTKAVLPAMKERGDGLIVNVSSQAGLNPALGGGVAYSTSKIGMEALNKVTNEEGNPYGIRACLLCPGSGNTPLISKRAHHMPDDERAKMIQPEDIADIVVFLASMPPRVTIDLVSIIPTKK